MPQDSPTNPVTDVELLRYVNGAPTETAYAEAKNAEAWDLVSGYIGTATVPDAVLVGAVLEVGSKLWNRRSATGSEAQWDTTAAMPALPAKDPMVTVYATLNRYLTGGFA